MNEIKDMIKDLGHRLTIATDTQEIIFLCSQIEALGNALQSHS